ncbi:type I-E CRISPR-associated protein Cse1/CasA [Streptomyces lavendulae]|uniref:type I-E CRISPR-associated protein Cse1/CasA n=1 Tax=Streptomyces lavendulae TaxID=1914 RepID=UPI0036BD7088
MPRFSLLDGSWIPVHDPAVGPDSASSREVGLREALTRADQLFFGCTASQDVALFRLLAAVYEAAVGPQSIEEWDAAFTGPVPAERIGAYLDRYADRFDLFHPETPFLQCADLEKASAGIGVLNLAHRGSEGSFFDGRLSRGVDEHPPMGPAQAARALLETLAFDTAGVRTPAPGDPSARGNKVYGSRIGSIAQVTHLHVTARGLPLHQQLLLNLPPGPRAQGDAPVWERPPAAAPMQIRPVAGPLDYWTLPTRRTRLFPNADGLVERVAVYDGDRAENGNWPALAGLDPMTAWETTKKGKLMPFSILDHSNVARPWATSILLTGRPENRPALSHVLAAAERGTIPGPTHLDTTAVQTVHRDRYRAVLAFVEVQQSLLGTAAQLADAQQRRALASRASQTDQFRIRLVAAAAGVTNKAPDQISQYITLSVLQPEWEEMVLTTAESPVDGHGDWSKALKDEALAQLRRIPLPARARALLAAEMTMGRLSMVLAPDPDPDEPEEPAPKKTGTGRKAAKYPAFGGLYSLHEIADLPQCVVSYPSLAKRVREGWDVEEAAQTPPRRGPGAQPDRQEP